MSDMENVKLSLEQLIAWFILEGWSPWKANYEEGRYGVRRGNSYAYAPELSEHDRYCDPNDADYEIDGDDGCKVYEDSIYWEQFPEVQLRAIYRKVSGHGSR